MVRPYVMTIAGFDPSAGAGVLSDIKCFEQHQVYGFGVCAALTVQTDNVFKSVDWLDAQKIIDQIAPLLEKFNIAALKIGLIRDLDVLLEVLIFLKRQSDMKIVLDPVMRASAGYDFHSWSDVLEYFKPVLQLLDLITPNAEEMLQLGKGQLVFDEAAHWSAYCPVLLKGGHLDQETGTDFLFDQGQMLRLTSSATDVFSKHGSGCVLSASITAFLAKGYSMTEACRSAKSYTEMFLKSNHTLLGYHENGEIDYDR